jgi:hypothetical protein
MLNHDVLTENVKPKLYSHANMYLEKQTHMGCWSHALFAILGNTIHPAFRNSSWLTASLIAFNTLGDGDDSILEPLLLCVPPDTAEGELEYLHLAEEIQKASGSKANELCRPSSQFTNDRVPPGSINKFIQILGEDPISLGLVKNHAHLLFSSLNNPLLETNASIVKDIYLGGKSLQNNEVVNGRLLIAEFENRKSNVMIMAIRSNQNSTIFHYVALWNDCIQKQIWFF